MSLPGPTLVLCPQDRQHDLEYIALLPFYFDDVSKKLVSRCQGDCEIDLKISEILNLELNTSYASICKQFIASEIEIRITWLYI